MQPKAVHQTAAPANPQIKMLKTQIFYTQVYQTFYVIHPSAESPTEIS